ncbi:carotenoid biosynthesis protein [Umezawaea endophytica]|uniref:Carotenoid biosynthesis protein n=1 Tax=Umezawaea endophytica TaxID=1654476 RepID=A0A9X3A3S1_9PSEU|nr:carotenoid biosynthesis protein [Umezawaea endophytica]MCS7480418.1 carotenoid biosynthesis protein [Umezawaea endophytica]
MAMTHATDVQVPQAGAQFRGKVLDVVQWVLVVAIVLVALLLPLTGTAAASVVLPLTIPFAFLHGLRRYGWRRFLTFFVVTFVVSNFFENLSVETGFPFGDYHYNGDLKFLHVPILVGPVYFGLGYVSWLCASIVLDRADERLDRRERVGKVNLVILPMLAAAVITMFDVAADAQASTVEGNWTWHDGGGVFGVPYTNYLGWWFVTYLYFQILAFILGRAQSGAPQGIRTVNDVSLVQPTLIYASLGLSFVPYFIGADTYTVVDESGAVWSTAAINETAMVVGLFTVVVIAFLALAKIARGDVGRRG